MIRWADALCLTASALILAASAPARARDLPDSFDFATTTIGKWSLTATTQIKWPDERYPEARNVSCRGENDDIQFGMDQSGTLTIRPRFLGFPDTNGERGEITLFGDRLWLYIDGDRWEFAHIAARPGAFSNVKYPPPESDIILPVWRGYEAARKGENDPWLNFNTLNQRLLSAKTIQWSYKSRNWKDVDARIPQNQLPKDWNKTRYPVDSAGLAGAVAWCARQVSSDAAYVLPATIKEAVKP